MNDEFRQLLQALEKVLEQRARPIKDKRTLLDLAARRFELESRLLVLLRPDRDSAPEKRRNVRVPCALEGRVRVAGRSHACQVKNLSCGGVMVELPLTLARGTLMELAVDPIPGLLPEPLVRQGEVAWAKAPSYGVRFLHNDAGTEMRIFRLVLALLRQRAS